LLFFKPFLLSFPFISPPFLGRELDDFNFV